MKSFWSIPLLLLFVAQVCYLPALSAWLAWHQEYVANELCINRFEPELMCSGKCYVQEVTSEALGHEQTGKPLPAQDNRLPVTPPLAEHLSWAIPAASISHSAVFPAVRQPLPALFCSGIFHPPRFTV